MMINTLNTLQYLIYIIKILEKSLQITKVKSLVDKYIRELISYRSEKDDWTKIEENYPTIALNVLCATT